MQQSKLVYEIDGLEFHTLEEFYDVVSRVLIPNAYWGRNLDAFNDILRGGFGTPEGGSFYDGRTLKYLATAFDTKRPFDSLSFV